MENREHSNEGGQEVQAVNPGGNVKTLDQAAKETRATSNTQKTQPVKVKPGKIDSWKQPPDDKHARSCAERRTAIQARRPRGHDGRCRSALHRLLQRRRRRFLDWLGLGWACSGSLPKCPRLQPLRRRRACGRPALGLNQCQEGSLRPQLQQPVASKTFAIRHRHIDRVGLASARGWLGV
ncbi:hypothetical protein BD289DRAFT_426608, partial [Coniella lustricola]